MLQLCMCLCVCVGAVWYMSANTPSVFWNVTVFVWFICITTSSCIWVCVSCRMCVCQGEWMVLCADGEVHPCVCVCVFSIFFRSLLVCLCVFACLHTPHLDRNSQMSFVCGRWDPSENQMHTVPKSNILYSLQLCSLVPPLYPCFTYMWTMFIASYILKIFSNTQH